MKLGSKYFDSIRVAPKRARSAAENVQSSVDAPPCQWKGCDKPGRHRAPVGRGRDGEYYVFCVDHVRQYNASYNYFDGMSDSDVAKFQKEALTGHRPTWKMGENPAMDADGGGKEHGDADGSAESRMRDPHGFFAWRAKQARAEAPERRRKLRPLEKKSLDALHLTQSASKEEIKAKFKALVKEHHPDANGGDRRSEDKLREIIQAYNYLKQAGLA